MNEEQFRQLCNVYGFAPSRALRELIDCVRMQEIEACADIADQQASIEGIAQDCATAIRARKENT